MTFAELSAPGRGRLRPRMKGASPRAYLHRLPNRTATPLEASIGGRRRFSSYAGGGGGKERLRSAQPATGPRGARSAPPNPYAPYYANLFRCRSVLRDMNAL